MVLEPLRGQFYVGDVLEYPPDHDQGNDLVLFADVNGDGLGEEINQEVNLVEEDEGKRRVDGGDGMFKERVIQVNDPLTG